MPVLRSELLVAVWAVDKGACGVLSRVQGKATKAVVLPLETGVLKRFGEIGEPGRISEMGDKRCWLDAVTNSEEIN